MSKTIVFFGSGPVACKSLELLEKSFQIEVIITKPKKNVRDSAPVLDFAERNNIQTITPQNKADLSKIFAKNIFISEVAILIDYGIILSQEVINYFPLGILNSHFSLLPQWRGADPITFSILSGQAETGVSLMLLTTGMDEGPLLAQAKIKINQDDTSVTLTDKLIYLSYKLITDHFEPYLSGELKPFPQQHKDVSYSRKLTKADGEIDWDKPADVIEREIRAYITWPKSFTKIGGREVIITKAHVMQENDNKPGHLRVIDKQIVVTCGKESLAIDMLKPSGKVEMSAQAFIAGYKI